MSELIATATATAYRAALASTGEVVPEPVLVRRVGHLLNLVHDAAAKVVAERWNTADLNALASGMSADGRRLPSKGWMVVRRLGWSSQTPEDVYVSDRVRRAIDEEAARALRLAGYRRSILAAIIATWPADPGKRTGTEWKDLRAALPDGVMAAEIRNRTRQVRDHLKAHGRLPKDLPDLEEPPRNAPQVLLAAADKQLVTIDRAGDGSAVLRVQLPLVESPASSRDWAWHVLEFTLPPNVPAHAQLCTPTLRVPAGRVRVDLPFAVEVPVAPATGHMVAVGYDWGLNTLLTGSAGHLVNGRVVSDGRMLRYDATAISAKLHRLRGHRENLAAKRTQYATLLAGITPADARWNHLLALHARIDREHTHVCTRIRHLNDALAWSAARWAVDQAQALGATVIYLEDLVTLETRGRRKGNARLSGHVRGTVVDAIRHLARKARIAVVTIPARGTSKFCPRCKNGARALKHTPAPDRPTSGWKWSICTCGLSADRDWAAAERIVSRGLLSQKHVRTDRKTGNCTTLTAVEGNVARSRRPKKPTRAARRARATDRDTYTRPDHIPRKQKSGPTPKRLTRPNNTSRQMPDRRLVPSPTPAQGRGQRPEGQAPQTNHPVRTGLARDSQHRTGFHRAHATPVLPLGTYGTTRGPATPVRNV
ncbi:MAG: hypothetical protein QOE54_5202 [Streptosporangiaceae bacterium]|nr:hypothetical protein [Streptosporangiaceae bacterium]MDX6432836.1 hypothetical protein [Streptosporangiaceae bacterium]